MRSKVRRPFIIFGAVFAMVLSGLLWADGPPGDGMQKATRPAQAARPDLNTDVAVENFNVSKTSVNDDESIRVSFRVKNLGKTKIKEVSYLVFMGELNLLVVRPHFQFEAGVFRDIPVGGQKPFSQNFTIPWNIDTARIKHIAVFLDKGEKLKEKDVSNNFGVERFNVSVRRRPDLTVTRLRFQRRLLPTEGGFINVSFTIKNIGRRTSLQCKYEAVGTAGHTKSGQTSIGTQRIYTAWEEVKTHTHTVRALRPNETMSATLRFPVPSGADNYKVHLWADYRNKVPESDERNNKKETTKK